MNLCSKNPNDCYKSKKAANSFRQEGDLSQYEIGPNPGLPGSSKSC